MIPKFLFAVAVAAVIAVPVAAHAGAAGGRTERAIEGCAASRSWLRRIADDRDPRADPRWDHQCPADAEARWEIEVVREPLADGHGGQITERVAEIRWTGGSLPDGFYDEFDFRTRLPNTQGATIRFPVVQECEEGVHRWVDVPADAQDAGDLPEPAPGVVLAN